MSTAYRETRTMLGTFSADSIRWHMAHVRDTTLPSSDDVDALIAWLPSLRP